MEITGGCFCGAIEYEAEMESPVFGICHCRDCQVFSGSAFRTSGFVSPDKFRFTRGEPAYFDKTADSGAVRRMAFCTKCGSHLCSLPLGDEADAGYVSIRVATSHQFEQMTPGFEVFCSSRVPWQQGIEGSTEFEKMPG